MAKDQRYAAFLRGVSPMNARMPELAAAFEAAGFTEVRTVASSGNVVFSAGVASTAALERRAEAAMLAELGRTFRTFVRPVAELEALLAAEPYGRFTLPPGAKRVVTFLPAPPTQVPALPVVLGTARILAVGGREAFSVYVPDPAGPAFMTLLERTFGKDITTRTWDALVRIVAARPKRARKA